MHTRYTAGLPHVYFLAFFIHVCLLMYKPHAFQLTAEEFAALKSQSMTSSAKAADLQGLHSNWSQFVTSSRKRRGARYRPYAFTAPGVAMLSSVLRRRAVEVNIATPCSVRSEEHT